ncbi:MAG: hypothetical protein WA906_11820, partial [Pacificimonas sp.]
MRPYAKCTLLLGAAIIATSAAALPADVAERAEHRALSFVAEMSRLMSSSWTTGASRTPKAAMTSQVAVEEPVTKPAKPGRKPRAAPQPPATVVVTSRRYPSYMPMTGLLPPKHEFYVLCEESIEAGREVLTDGKKLPWGNYSGGGVEMVYEARADDGSPCVYNFAPWTPTMGSGRNAWPSGSQFHWKSSERGVRVTFRTDSDWATLRFRPGKSEGKRFHFEVTDFDLDFHGAIQPHGALWLESYPTASEGGLSSLVVRNSRVTGGKNALFVPSGASMLYVEDSEIGRNVGRHVDQQHPVYLNGTLVAHFKDTLVFGDHAVPSAGGHILKLKSALRLLENVTLDNGGGLAVPTDRPLADFSGHGWTWSENLNLIRRASPGSTRPTMVDVRRDRYLSGRMKGPWPDAKGFTMPTELGDCSGDVADQVYLHVFKDTVTSSEVKEPNVFRMAGLVDVEFEGIHPRTSHA